MDTNDLAIKITEHSEKIKTVFSRIEELEKRTDDIQTLTLSVQKLAMSVENMCKEQGEYKQTQKEIAKRLTDVEHSATTEKANKWDAYTRYAVTFVIGAVLGYLLMHLLGI